MPDRYEVQTRTECDGWVNVSTDETGNLIRYASKGEAFDAMMDELADLYEAVRRGDLKDYAPKDLRVAEVG